MSFKFELKDDVVSPYDAYSTPSDAPGSSPPQPPPDSLNPFDNRNKDFVILKNKGYDTKNSEDAQQRDIDAFSKKMSDDNIGDFNYSTDLNRSAFLMLSALGCVVTDEFDSSYSTLDDVSKTFVSRNPNLLLENKKRPSKGDLLASDEYFSDEDDPFFKDTVPSGTTTKSGLKRPSPGETDPSVSLAAAYSTVYDAPRSPEQRRNDRDQSNPTLLTEPFTSVAVEAGAVEDEATEVSRMTNVTTRRDRTVVANTQTAVDTTTDMFGVGGFGSY
tara:strand:+ start:762 stop:1580 length:819 start_codon:yes stop_codon:yes gene_type:complete